MPVLHAYRSKEGHYVLAGVKGKNMITTSAALERLLDRSGLTGDDTVASYRDLLSLNLEAKYLARVRPKSKPVQPDIFPGSDGPQQSLL